MVSLPNFMMLLLSQWRAEWLKLLARKRTYIGFAAFLLLEAVILVVFQFEAPEKLYRRLIVQQGGAFEEYFSALTLGFIVQAISVGLLGSIYLALVSGDIVAKESEDGNLRLLLARPISRLRLLALKYATCSCYAFLLVQFIAWTAFLLGLAMRGWGGGLFAFSPELKIAELWSWELGLQRYALGAIFLGFSMITVSSVAFFLSCFKIKPAAATITALSYILIDSILLRSNLMKSYEFLLVSQYMEIWGRAYADPIPWALVTRGYSVLIAVNLSLFTLGAAWFQSRDLKS
jgi:ABC-2 type transport system permease protein